jgi:hypothetical protein
MLVPGGTPGVPGNGSTSRPPEATGSPVLTPAARAGAPIKAAVAAVAAAAATNAITQHSRRRAAAAMMTRSR